MQVCLHAVLSVMHNFNVNYFRYLESAAAENREDIQAKKKRSMTPSK